MDLTNSPNLPRTSHESILFMLEGKSYRVFLIKLYRLEQSVFVEAWNCWYLANKDYQSIKEEKGNIRNIKRLFAKSLQVTIN